MCLGANVARFLVLSMLSNPWMVLPLQVVQGDLLLLSPIQVFVVGVSLATVWASASSYISLTAPEHLKSKAQFLLLLLYHGFGKGLGTILGGLIISSTGDRIISSIFVNQPPPLLI
jgi:MFS-type transporter involved in bile tolerance (Atg22 family)